MKLKLTELQKDLLVGSMQARAKAVERETEALKMVFATHGEKLPSDGNIMIEGDFLVLTLPEDKKDAIKEAEVVA